MSRTLLPLAEKNNLKTFDIATRKSIPNNAYLLELDPMTCNEKILPYLAQVWQVPFWDNKLEVAEKRQLIVEAKDLHKHIGTKWAITKAIRIAGVEGEVVEWWEQVDDPFSIFLTKEPYSFTVVAGVEKMLDSGSSVVLDSATQERLIEFVGRFKNVRSKFELLLKAQYNQEVSAVSNFSVTQLLQKDLGQNSTKVANHSTIAEVSNFSMINTSSVIGATNKSKVANHSTIAEVSNFSMINTASVIGATNKSKVANHSTIAEVSNFSMINTASVMGATKSKQEVDNEMCIVGNINLLVIGGQSNV